MRALIYCRVSTDEQAEHGYSLASQAAMTRERAETDGLVVAETYIDDGYSGATTDRPGLQALLADMSRGDTIYCYRLDRLSRDVEHMAAIMRLCQKQGVAVKPLVGAADLGSSLGRAFVNIQSVFAQLERETIAERVTVGMRRRVASGKPYSRPPVGYVNGGTEWRIDPDGAQIVRRMAQLRLSGMGFHRIADTLEQEGIAPLPGARNWIASTVQRILTNPVYGGQVRYGDVRVDLPVEPILDPDTWHQLQTLNQARAFSRSRCGSPYLLSGLLWCDCGYRMAAHQHSSLNRKTGRRHRYNAYRCNSSTGPSGTAHTNLIAAGKLDLLVLARLDAMAAGSAAVVIPAPTDPRPASNARLQALDAELDNLEAALLQGRITGERYDKHKARIETARREVAQRAVVDVDGHRIHLAVTDQLRRLAGTLAATYERDGATAALKTNVQRLVERVEVTRRIRPGWGLEARDVAIRLRIPDAP